MTVLKSALIQRVALFVVIFLLISGLSGSWLISTQKLLFPFYFSIYGSAGKVFLFAIVAFLLMTRHWILTVTPKKLTLLNYVLVSASALSLVGFFVLAQNLTNYKHFSEAIALSIATHSTLWLAGLCAVLGVFGEKYLLQIAKVGWKALLIGAILATLFYLSFTHIFKLWPYLSAIVLWSVTHLLSLKMTNVTVIPPLTIQLPQFSVTVGEYCSGIESLFLISVLYFLIGCLEWFSLHKVRFLLLYCPLIIGMFGLNIVRVYGIIQAGIWFGPEIAARLFHTYLGIILFMAYFFLFWKFLSPVVINNTSKKGANTV